MPTPPPLAWLRAFEAAARLGSFRAAASDLSVTPSTVSHQVRDLEARLGVPLFTRQGRGLALTLEGEGYASSLRTGFDLIRNAEIPDRDDRRLRLGAFPFVTNEVLVPNLPSLRARLPGVRLSLHSTTHLHSLSAPDPRARVDAVIRYGSGSFPGCLWLKIADVYLAPIVPRSASAIGNLQDLLNQPIVRVRGPFDGWQVWTEGMGIADSPLNGVVLETDSYHAATLAVERGVGVALGVLPYLRPLMRSQRVMVMEDLAVPVEEGSYLVYAPYREHDQNIVALHEWLLGVLELNAGA